MYPDYNNVYNPYGGMEFNPRQMQPQMERSEEIITLQQAIELIKKSVGNEKEDELFYEEIIKQAPTEKEKSILRSIRDDERKHNKILRNLYFKFTGQMLSESAQGTGYNSNTNTQTTQSRRTYTENLEKALFGELEAVIKYRRIMGAMPDNDSYTLIMSIMTDELRHASKYNFLIHNAKR